MIQINASESQSKLHDTKSLMKLQDARLFRRPTGFPKHRRSLNISIAIWYDLTDETVLSHKQLIIIGKKSNAVLISEKYWESVQETFYLLSIPNMRESIREGLSTPTEECAKELDW